MYKAIENNDVKEITPRILGLLKEQKDSAFLSYKLSTINKNVDIDFNLDDCENKPINLEKLRDLFIKLEFKTLLDRVLQLENKNIEQMQEIKVKKNNRNSIMKLYIVQTLHNLNNNL